MLKQLITGCFCLGLGFAIAQQPMIGTYTIIPQTPTAASFIKIVTNVTTSNLSIVVDLNHTVTASQIRINGCYAQGMATALQTHIDTFMIGQLPPGNYSIMQKAYLSAAQQWCNKTDSNSVAGTIQVGGTTGVLKNFNGDSFALYPNPTSDKISIRSVLPIDEVLVFSAAGALVFKGKRVQDDQIDVSLLPAGLYFVRINIGEKILSRKFLKTGIEQ